MDSYAEEMQEHARLMNRIAFLEGVVARLEAERFYEQKNLKDLLEAAKQALELCKEEMMVTIKKGGVTPAFDIIKALADTINRIEGRE